MPETVAGWLHFGLAAVALLAGAAVLAARKGTARHRALGRACLAAMVGLNLAALTVYVDSPDGPGVFHALALVSLTTVSVGWLTVRRGAPGPGRAIRHGIWMSWSIAGLAGAGLGQLFAGLGLPPTPAIVAALALGGWLIHRRGLVARAAGRYRIGS